MTLMEFESGATVPVTNGVGGRRFFISDLIESDGLRVYGSETQFFDYDRIKKKFTPVPLPPP